jgi:hypothetical protein
LVPVEAVQLAPLTQPAVHRLRLAHCLPVLAAVGVHLAAVVTAQYHLAVVVVAVQAVTVHVLAVQRSKVTQVEQRLQIFLTVQVAAVVVLARLVVTVQGLQVAQVAQVKK